MVATWPDGRTVTWFPYPPNLSGDIGIRARAMTWMGTRKSVDVTPTGPTVPADWTDKEAAFTAINETEPGALWENPPDLLYGEPDGTVF